MFSKKIENVITLLQNVMVHLVQLVMVMVVVVMVLLLVMFV